MFTQVVSSVYSLMEEYPHLWNSVKGSQPVPTFGFHYEVGLEPIYVNVERMIGNFRLGTKDLMEIWKKILPPDTAQWLESISRLSNEAFSFGEDLWVRIVYDFAVAYHKGSVHREHLLKSMIPLYLGRVASFVKENKESSSNEVEEKIESLCRVFEEMKPYLMDRWDQTK
jgi:hypothetical protein